MQITIWIPGHPAPGGSKSAFPFKRKDGSLGVRVTDAAGKRNKDWKTVCALRAVAVMKERSQFMLRGPLDVRFEFRLPRPKSHYHTGKQAGTLRCGSPVEHVTRPDVGKLARAVEDALTGIVWEDDAQIVDQTATKSYIDMIKPLAGCMVTVKNLSRK